jgi:hypothetical protein
VIRESTWWLLWRRAGGGAWQRYELWGEEWSRARARDHFASLVRSGASDLEPGRTHEARLYRNGIAIACWEEDGRP